MADPGQVTAPQRTLAIVHNNIDEASSIGAIARWQAQEALARGWRVVAVCRDLDPELAARVTHVPLYVPPRLHLLQWSVARATVRAALRGVAYDLLMVHQPQLAGIADLWNVHYLSRAAREVRVRPGPDWRSRAQDVQAAGVARLEDRYLSHLPTSTRVLFCSERISEDFARLYGTLPNSRVLHNPALFEVGRHADRPDRTRRYELVGDHQGPVIGFLGGSDPRKGGDLLLRAVEREPDLLLLHAGSRGLPDGPRTRYLGHLSDVGPLLDVVDALVVPSRFDPFALVVGEAAARGVPVITSSAVGSARLITDAGAGAIWDGGPLTPIVSDLITRRSEVSAAAVEFARALDPHRIADELFAEIEAVWRAKERR